MSGRMINYPVYDAYTKKANFTREQPMHPSSPKAHVCNRTYSLYFIMHALGIRTVFYELEM